jgi:uncharacterized membrane protein
VCSSDLLDFPITDQESHAYLWTKKHGMQRLDTPDKKLSRAYSTNHRGQIVGNVWKSLPWWVEIWDRFAKKRNLPVKYWPFPSDYREEEAVLWTIPPAKADTR